MIENKFKIVIPVYNSEKWIEKCIFSVLNQSYKNFELIVINDASTDHTGQIIDAICKDHPFQVIHRKQNVGALKNIVDGIKQICNDDEDTIVTLDGDDLLYHADVLKYLNEVYQQKDLWLTYGSYIDLASQSTEGNAQLISTREYRRSGLWCTSHLRSWKYHLWKHIKEEDLKDKNGNWYMISYDNALIFPLLETAGLHRIKYIKEVLYIYNNLNPLNDFKRDVNLQWSTAAEIRRKPIYDELP